MPTATETNAEVRQLEPRSLWNFFADLNAVPRASKQEARVIEFAKSFGESLALETVIDAAGNVLIRKPATPGMEACLPIVMQSHLDMVHQKNNDTDFDFATQGIEMYVDDDWVKARGTTLGADNGIGVATIMALLASKDIAHPALEALFTIDEETGMTGAKQLQPGWLSGSILLNLDTEEDNELTIGCAGGVDVSCQLEFESTPAPAGYQTMQIVVRGLNGGHSGMDIHKGLGNANKLMNRLLQAIASGDGHIVSIEGGGLRNAIPRESTAVVLLPGDFAMESLTSLADELQSSLSDTESGLEISFAECDAASTCIPTSVQQALLETIDQIPNGVVAMSASIEGLVETSNNLARVQVLKGKLKMDCLARSSVNPERQKLAESIGAIMSGLNAKVSIDGDYPGWAPNPDATIVDLMRNVYVDLFSEPPHVSACHAGLECGLLGQHYPDMEMISFGPTIRGAHSPDERVSISSVQKFWSYLLETLKRIPPAN